MPTKITFDVDDQLGTAFADAAKANRRAVADLLPELMRSYLRHDLWFRAEVEQALREADDPQVLRIPGAEVAERWEDRRKSMIERADGTMRE
jgi:hypothetical protein